MKEDLSTIHRGHPWINFETYTVTELLCLGIGTLFWIYAYYAIVRNAMKYKKVEMPFLAVCSNIAWEFSWGFMLYTDLGRLFEWGLRVWFFMDVFIFYFTITDHTHRKQEHSGEP